MVRAPVITLGETLPGVPWSLWEELPGSPGTHLARVDPCRSGPASQVRPCRKGHGQLSLVSRGSPGVASSGIRALPSWERWFSYQVPPVKGWEGWRSKPAVPEPRPMTLGQWGEVRAQLRDLRAHGFGDRDSHLGVQRRGWGGRDQPDICPAWALAIPLHPSTLGGSHFSCTLSPEFPQDAGMPSRLPCVQTFPP